jgi:hypothetical protein
MSNATHILNKALESAKANALALKKQRDEKLSELHHIDAQIINAVKAVSELEESITYLENKDYVQTSSKNKKTK